MKKTFVPSVICGLFFSGVALAFDIKDEMVIPSGETESRAVPFAIDKANARVMLPVRSLYTGRILNEAHTVAAINYHETSDYDGVDLVVANGKDISVIPNVWSLIEAAVQQKKILPVQQWGRMEFTVKSITGNKVQCAFRGIVSKTDAVVEKEFSFSVGSPKDPLALQVQ